MQSYRLQPRGPQLDVVRRRSFHLQRGHAVGAVRQEHGPLRLVRTAHEPVQLLDLHTSVVPYEKVIRLAVIRQATQTLMVLLACSMRRT